MNQQADGDTIAIAWTNHLESILGEGTNVNPRGQQTMELLNHRFVLWQSRFNLLDHPTRKLNHRFAVAEWLWMAFGRSDVESIAQYNSALRAFSDDGTWFVGAYGPHILAQRDAVLDKLRRDPATRQAVIEIPRPRRVTKDEPCTVAFQFLLRGDALNLIVTMRSSDAWLGVPYDVFNFTQLQNSYAGVLGVNRGWLAINMGSAHLYEQHWDVAHTVTPLDDPASDAYSIYSPDLSGHPPDWLEHVLLYRDERSIPADAGVWERYARALVARSIGEATGALR